MWGQTAFFAHVVSVLFVVGRVTDHARRDARAAKRRFQAHGHGLFLLFVRDGVALRHVAVRLVRDKDQVRGSGVREQVQESHQWHVPVGEVARRARLSVGKAFEEA